MLTDITHVTVLVDDLDAGHEFYTETLGFETREDVTMDDGTRWLTVAPSGVEFPQLTLMEPSEGNEDVVGRQAGEFVYLVLESDDVQGDFETLRERGVEFRGEPTDRPWGTEVVFEDPWGNAYDLLEPAER